jgi:hypothetical protein
MGLTIQPLTSEEVDHRMTMARLFQRSTLAQLKTAAELYQEDLLGAVKEGDPASAAQCLVELGRRGEWSENALATVERRKLVDAYADATDAQLEILEGGLPHAGFITAYVAMNVHLIRAERWLRGHEARLERERKLVHS